MAGGAPTLHGKAEVTVASETHPMTGGGEYTHTSTQDANGNSVGFHDTFEYPNGTSRDIKTTIDPNSGQSTTTITERDGNEVLRTGTVTRDSEGKEVYSGDETVFNDDNGPPRPKEPTNQQDTSTESPSTEGEGKENPDEKKKPEEDGQCTDCGNSEPSIWHDLGTFAWGFVKGAVIGFAITALLMSVSAPVAAGLGIGLAVLGGIGLLWEGYRAITGQMTRDEAIDLAGGFFGGLFGAGMAGRFWPKPKPVPAPQKPPPPEEPPLPEPAPPPPEPAAQPRPEPRPKPPPPPGRGVWSLDPKVRGTIIEQRLGQNLPQNFPTIDRFENGIATSIKSVDLAAKSYLKPGNLMRLVRGYINKVADFQGRNWAGVNIKPGDIAGRGLDLAIPPGTATPEQLQVLQALIQFGRDRGVNVRIVEIQ
ncbi:MAG: hypothetical protein U0794_01865 [Isosphaeraceae bacterium]